MRLHPAIALVLAGACAVPPFERATPEPPEANGENRGGTSSPWGSPGPMYGDMHRLIFNITGFCDGVCPNRYVLLAGTRNNGAAVNLPPFGVPAAACRTFQIRSSDPTVAAVRAMEQRKGDRLCIAVGGFDNMTVDANGAGDALLTVLDEAGQVFDRIEIHVRQAAGVLLWDSERRDVAATSITRDRHGTGPLVRQFSGFPVDPAGQRIVTAERITYDIADPAIATFTDFGGDVASLASSDIVLLRLLSPGTTTLRLTFGAFQKSYTLVVE